MNLHSHMFTSTSRNVKSIPPRPRVAADLSKETTRSNAIRSECLSATMRLIAKLDTMGNGQRHAAAVRSLMLFSYMVPAKVICVGLFPYEQDILPPIASALAYSPASCLAPTPGVQILAQAMAAAATVLKERYANRNGYAEAPESMKEDSFLRKFTMMLRCSYLCAAAGVFFTNASPTPVDTTAKRIRVSSHFAEWLGSMLMIHSRFGYRPPVVSMGAFASATVKRCFSSFPGASSMTNHIACMNPAAISYMNLNAELGESPIPSEVTDMERKVAEAVGVTMVANDNKNYDWKQYPEGVIIKLMGKDAITILARALADRTVDELAFTSLSMMSGLFAYVQSSGGGNMIASEDANANMNMGEGGITDANQGTGSSGNRGSYGNAGEMSSGGRGSFGGPFQPKIEVNKKSLIGQMMDPMNRNKSQQVLVIEHMVKSVADLVEMYKNRDVKINALEQEVRKLHDWTNRDEDMDEFLSAYKQEMSEAMEDLKSAAAVIAAMPAVIDGDRGVIEAEIQPAAPLMRRADGTSIRDSLFVFAKEQGDPHLSGNSPTTEFAGTPVGTQTAAYAPSSPRPSSNAFSNARTEAADFLLEILGENADENVSEAMMMSVKTRGTAGETTDMTAVLIEAIAVYSLANEGRVPSKSGVMNVIAMAHPPTDEIVTEVANMIADVTTDPEALSDLFYSE